jgi:hypothetical protein
MAARSEGIPLVSIAEADFLSPAVNSWMPWFDGKPEDLLPHPSCLPAFRALARELGLGEVPHVGSLLWGDLTIVPSIPELDPVDSLPGARGDVLYAGPMFWDPPGTSVELPTAAGHHVYVTLGSGEMCSDATVEKILSGCARSEWSVFLSRGQGSTAGLRTPDNVTVAGFTGLARPLGWSDVVVSHGGSASVIASLAHDRPLVVVPFMSECEMNGRQYVERSGAGIVVRKSTFDPVAKRLGFCDRTGAPMEDFRPDDVASAVAEVLGEPRYQQAARQVGARLRRARERQGRFAEMVTDLVERHAMRSQRALGSSS